MLVLLLAFVASLMVTLGVIHLSKTHGRFSLDHDVSGPQKFHARPVPRIGGVGIVAGLVAALALLHWTAPSASQTGTVLMVCALPCFAGGLIEDLTKRVSPRMRLIATAVSAALAAWVLDAAITRADIPVVDLLVATTTGSLVVTVFAVAGIANSINIIDGFNGLASMCAMIMLAALAYVAFQVGDIVLVELCVATVGAVLGFFLWNFPGGLIFLGDGGAYFMGFYLAEVAILLLARNPTVSPMFPLLLCIYPVFETLFSIYRRLVVKRVHPGVPDVAHLHHLIYKRLVRGLGVPGVHDSRVRRNAMTSPYLWVLTSTGVAPALIFWDNKAILMVGALLFSIAYAYGYGRIVKFRVPSWWLRRKLDGGAEPTRRRQP